MGHFKPGIARYKATAAHVEDKRKRIDK